MANKVQNLLKSLKIVEADGTPSIELMRILQGNGGLTQNAQDRLEMIEAENIVAGFAIDGGGKIGDYTDITLDLNLQEALDSLGTTTGDLVYRDVSGWTVKTLSDILDGYSSVQGAIIYRGTSGWTALGPGTSGYYLKTQGAAANPVWASVTSGGTVTTVSVATANGFSGTVATATTTPVITMKTTITGLLKGNGTAISAAVAGTDYLDPSNDLSDVSSATTALTNLGLYYRFGFFFTTTPTSSEVLCLHVAPVAFTIPANFSSPNSVGNCATSPTSSFAIDVQRNGSTIGTITIGTGGSFTFATSSGTSKSITVGDVLKFVAPSSADATCANVAISIQGAY